MKRVFYLFVFLVIAYACQKQFNHETAAKQPEFESLKEWLVANGEIYSNGRLIINSGQGNITGLLNWRDVHAYKKQGLDYFEVPFLFAIGNIKTKVISTTNNNTPPTLFSIVFRKFPNGSIQAKLRTKTYYTSLESTTETKKGSIESFYNLNGTWLNSWFYENDIRSTKIYKVKDQGYSARICHSYSTTSYETQCWSNGGANNGTTCTKVPIIVRYSYCATGEEETQLPDWGSGGLDGGGGSGTIDSTIIVNSIRPDTGVINNSNVNCIYQALMNDSLQNGLRNILSGFSNSGATITFILYDFGPGDDTTKGATGNNGNNYYCKISRYFASDPNYSRIRLAKTFIHEAFHAQLRQKAIELFGSTEVSSWPVNISNGTLAELSYYFYNASLADNSWNSIGHQWMIEHIEACAQSLKEFVQRYYPDIYNMTGGDDKAFISLFYDGLEQVPCYAGDLANRGLTQQQVEALQAVFSSLNCP